MSRRGWKVWLTVAECRANERRLGRVNGAARRDISSGADLRPNEPWCLNDPEDRAPGTCLSTCTDKSNESRCGRTDTCTCLLMSCRTSADKNLRGDVYEKCTSRTEFRRRHVLQLNGQFCDCGFDPYGWKRIRNEMKFCISLLNWPILWNLRTVYLSWIRIP